MRFSSLSSLQHPCEVGGGVEPLPVEMIMARLEKVVGGLGIFTQYARQMSSMTWLCLFIDGEPEA